MVANIQFELRRPEGAGEQGRWIADSPRAGFDNSQRDLFEKLGQVQIETFAAFVFTNELRETLEQIVSQFLRGGNWANRAAAKSERPMPRMTSK
jgi:hypothetical protein